MEHVGFGGIGSRIGHWLKCRVVRDIDDRATRDQDSRKQKAQEIGQRDNVDGDPLGDLMPKLLKK